MGVGGAFFFFEVCGVEAPAVDLLGVDASAATKRVEDVMTPRGGRPILDFGVDGKTAAFFLTDCGVDAPVVVAGGDDALLTSLDDLRLGVALTCPTGRALGVATFVFFDCGVVVVAVDLRLAGVRLAGGVGGMTVAFGIFTIDSFFFRFCDD